MQLNNCMSYRYCWNQPKKYGKYDLYLDGKIKADDFEYKIKNQNGQTESVSMSQLFKHQKGTSQNTLKPEAFK